MFTSLRNTVLLVSLVSSALIGDRAEAAAEVGTYQITQSRLFRSSVVYTLILREGFQMTLVAPGLGECATDKQPNKAVTYNYNLVQGAEPLMLGGSNPVDMITGAVFCDDGSWFQVHLETVALPAAGQSSLAVLGVRDSRFKDVIEVSGPIERVQ